MENLLENQPVTFSAIKPGELIEEKGEKSKSSEKDPKTIETSEVDVAGQNPSNHVVKESDEVGKIKRIKMLVTIMEALDKWSDLPFDVRKEVAEMARDLVPESSKTNFDNEIEQMQENEFKIPACVHAAVGPLKKAGMATFLSESKLLVALNGDPFQLAIKEGEIEYLLSNEWQKIINEHRELGN